MSNIALSALLRAREWMLLDDTYGNAEQFRVDLEFVDSAIASLTNPRAGSRVDILKLVTKTAYGIGDIDCCIPISTLNEVQKAIDEAGTSMVPSQQGNTP